MDAHPNSVADVFSGQKQYVIPVFQRTYEWGQDKWEIFWQDLRSISEETDQNISHFIGPMVVITNVVVPYDVPKFLVIDGQQRLMTLTVILAAIRDRAKALRYDDLDRSINTNSLTFLNTKGTNVPYIVPRLRDRDTLYNILEKKGSQVDTTLLLTKAYKYFCREIEQLTPLQSELFKESNDNVLEKIYKTVTQRLEVVLITLDNHDNPSNIYESLNFKHETLADADLIRNYVFMKIGSLDEQETFDGAYWKEFEGLFGNADTKKTLSDFYYRYLICKKAI